MYIYKNILRICLALCCLAMLFACGEEELPKCDDFSVCDMTDVSHNYFRYFSFDGRYWISQNQDSTLTDTVSIINYVSEFFNNEDSCYQWEWRSMDLVSRYLSEDTIKIVYSNETCEESIFDFFGEIKSNNKDDVLYTETPEEIELIDTFYIRNQTWLPVTDVVKYRDRYWFSKNVGLIKYVSYNNKDTFHLYLFSF